MASIPTIAYKRHTPLKTIIVDGWGMALHREQVLGECIASGYSLCIAEPLLNATWARMDADYTKCCESFGVTDSRSFSGTY